MTTKQTAAITGSSTRCPMCSGFGSFPSAENPWRFITCPACRLTLVESAPNVFESFYAIELPVSPEVRDLLGEAVVLRSGLEWDGIEGERAESEAA